MKTVSNMLHRISGRYRNEKEEAARLSASLHEATTSGDAAVIRRFLRDHDAASFHPHDQANCLGQAVLDRRADILTAFVEADWNLGAGADVDLTALSLAVVRGDAEFVRILISLGADVNLVESLGNTPFTWAAGFLDWQIVEIMKEAGAIVTCREAALLGDNDALFSMLEPGTDINAADRTEYTLLRLAVANGRAETARALLEIGSNPNPVGEGRYSISPLCLAARGLPYSCHFEEYMRLLKHRRRDWSDRPLPPPSAYHETAEVLIKYGASDFEKGLEYAIQCDSPAILDIILPKTAHATLRFTPLALAVSARSPDCLNKLIELGEDVNGHPTDPTDHSLTQGSPIRVAVSWFISLMPPEHLRAFGETGVRTAGYDLWTLGGWPDTNYGAWHFQPERHNKLMAMLITLLDAGADPNIDGVLVTAAERGYSSVVEILLRYGAVVHAAEAVLFGSMDMLKASIERGDDVELASWDGGTALIFAAEVGNGEAVRLLLDSGANINAAKYGGWTPLMFATAAGNPEIVRLLLAHGSRIDAVHKGDDTPMSLAKAIGNREIIDDLRQAKKIRGRDALSPGNGLRLNL